MENDSPFPLTHKTVWYTHKKQHSAAITLAEFYSTINQSNIIKEEERMLFLLKRFNNKKSNSLFLICVFKFYFISGNC